MASSDLCSMSATELAPLLHDGSLSAAHLLEAVLTRIDTLEPTLNAFALVDRDGARQAAAKADAAQAAGAVLGPLHGIPFSVKDLILTEGIETAFGSHLAAGNIPTQDAAVVARMKAAGAVLIGKTTTPEFAHAAITDSLRYGPTHNPWNPDYSCGGSSGGAAVAAATGMGPLTVTTDGAGSSRIPASCCGVLGLKATLGRIPNENAADLFGNFICLGAITRTTADLVAMLNVMSGPHAGDPWTRGMRIEECVAPGDPQPKMRGVRAHYKPRLGNELLDDGVAAVMERMLDLLSGVGVAVTRSDGREDWGNELARVCIRGTLGARMAQYSEADREKMTSTMRAAIAESEALDKRAMQDAPMQRSALYRQTEAIFADADLLLTPCVSAPPPRIGRTALDPILINDEPAGAMRANWYNYPAPFNLTGHPAISIPIGHTPDGLPVGLQAVAPWHGEQKLIDLAAAIEQISPWDWPPIAKAAQNEARP